MQKFLSFFIHGAARYWTLGALIVLALGYYIFFVGGANTSPTMLVSRADFSTQVAVSGTVTATHAVDLGFSQSGRVAVVSGDVGQHVAAGTVLASVENGELRAAVAQKQAALTAARANLDLLRQGTRPEELAVAQASVTNNTAALAQANQAVVNAYKNAYTTADAAVHNTVDQFLTNARTPSPQLLFVSSNAALATRLLAERVILEHTLATWQASSVAISATSDLDATTAMAQANLASVAALLDDANMALNQVGSPQGLTSTQITTSIANTATARTALNAAISTLTSASIARQSAAAALDAATKQLVLERAGSTSASIDAQAAQVQVAEADVESAQAQLAKTMIIAPFSGVITRMDAKVGQIISPSDTEISMMGDGLFEIDTYVPELSVAGVVAGNLATTTLDAYGTSIPFASKVVSVDPAETIKEGVPTYKTTLTFLSADPRIRSGMTANVVIVTGVLRDAIVVPQGAIGSKSGQSYASVLVDEKPVNKPVTTGIAPSLGQVEVKSGLVAGEVLLLTPSP